MVHSGNSQSHSQALAEEEPGNEARAELRSVVHSQQGAVPRLFQRRSLGMRLGQSYTP